MTKLAREPRGRVMRKEFEDAMARIGAANRWAVYNNVQQMIGTLREAYGSVRLEEGCPPGSLGYLALLWPAGALGRSIALPPIEVIATAPLPGAGIDRDKVPAMVQTLTAEDFSRTYSPYLTDTLFQRIPGVSTSDQQGNSFQNDIRYRGFVVSPVPGQPQGLAVYMNGVRINEAFGDAAGHFWWTQGETIGLAAIVPHVRQLKCPPAGIAKQPRPQLGEHFRPRCDPLLSS